MPSITVDIDELVDKLESMKEDDYVSAKLTLVEDDYTNELAIAAVGIEDEEEVSYGTLDETRSEI